mmetsp:Transcript_30567/g.101698  ORF Transcript_30567/g.101698 Transcript_30567/m.101698 type:complete len:241 (-) Transcript_30567:340-1062(-)
MQEGVVSIEQCLSCYADHGQPGSRWAILRVPHLRDETPDLYDSQHVRPECIVRDLSANVLNIDELSAEVQGKAAVCRHKVALQPLGPLEGQRRPVRAVAGIRRLLLVARHGHQPSTTRGASCAAVWGSRRGTKSGIQPARQRPPRGAEQVCGDIGCGLARIHCSSRCRRIATRGGQAARPLWPLRAEAQSGEQLGAAAGEARGRHLSNCHELHSAHHNLDIVASWSYPAASSSSGGQAQT